MHKFSTASTKSSTLPALHSVGLLNLPYSTFAGADPQTGALARGATHSGRRVASCDKNLCIIRVNPPSRIRSVQSPSSEPCPNNLIDFQRQVERSRKFVIKRATSWFAMVAAAAIPTRGFLPFPCRSGSLNGRIEGFVSEFTSPSQGVSDLVLWPTWCW